MFNFAPKSKSPFSEQTRAILRIAGFVAIVVAIETFGNVFDFPVSPLAKVVAGAPTSTTTPGP